MNLESLKAERHPSASMTIDLNAVKHNLAQCRQRLQATTRIMLVLKAHAYGTNVKNTTHWAQQTGEIDYIAVAFVDEGVQMRQLGITLPIMVMNIEDTAFQVCQTFDLEPVIYSLSILDKLVQWLNKSKDASFSPSRPHCHTIDTRAWNKYHTFFSCKCPSI